MAQTPVVHPCWLLARRSQSVQGMRHRVSMPQGRECNTCESAPPKQPVVTRTLAEMHCRSKTCTSHSLKDTLARCTYSVSWLTHEMSTSTSFVH